MKKVIHTETEEQYDKLMERLESEWYIWSSWKKLTNFNTWDSYYENTCINIESEVDVSYSSKQYYIDKWYTILSFKEYMWETFKVGELVWVSDVSQEDADEYLKDYDDNYKHYYTWWITKDWEHIIETDTKDIYSWKYISKTSLKEETIEIETKDGQVISITKEKAEELWFNI